MRILHVIPGLAISSGPTKVILRLSTQQAIRGEVVTVYCLKGRLDGLEESVLPKGVSIERFPVRGPRFWGWSSELGVRLQDQVNAFDIVHVHSLWCYQNVAVWRACRRDGVAYIVRPAGSLQPWAMTVSPWRKRLYLALLEKRVLRDAAALHAMSDKEAETLKGLDLNAHVFTVPNGIDCERFALLGERSKQSWRRELNLPEQVPLLLYLGRIHPVKGLDLAAEMMVEVRHSFPDAVLVVAGPDQHTYARHIRDVYRRAGLENNVIFLGEVDEGVAAKLYAAADLFVLPSKSENFGNVVLESMAAGTPPVVSQDTPWKELDEWQAGRWVKRDASAFAGAVVTLLGDGDTLQKFSRRAREVAQKHFGWDSVTERLLDEYRRILRPGQFGAGAN